MRPSKHVTHSMDPAQAVFDISIARLTTGQNVPVVTTSEVDAITLFAWSIAPGAWLEARIPHAPVSVVSGEPSISNTWNWSRRVGLTTLDKLIFVVYKRAPVITSGQPPQPAILMLDIFRLNPVGTLERVSSFPVPMPTYLRPGGINLVETPQEPGFELWAGIDHVRRKLLIVTQAYQKEVDPNGESPRLTLMEGDVRQLDDPAAWRYSPFGDGGFGMDVRHQGDELIFAFRTQASVVDLRHPRVMDAFFREAHVETNAGTDSDQYFFPIKVLRMTLPDRAITTSELPGGEHPRIQSVSPLIVTIDRPQLRVDFRVDPARGTVVNWQVQGVDKLIFLFDDENPLLIFRGVLMSFPAGNSLIFPRTQWPWLAAQDLYTEHEADPIGWTSIWARFSVEPLGLSRDSKNLFFDFLHKSPKFALLRARAHFSLNFDEDLLTLVDLKSEVYDINHAQIRHPDQLEPDSWGENTQFQPFDSQRPAVGRSISGPSYYSDNTIGGSLVNDRDGIPHQFVSYIDLGDGGLRVVFDANLPPPDEPTQPEHPKKLDPGSVPGPGSGDEQWFVLNAADWSDAQVPAIDLSNALVSKPFTPILSITSSVHCQIEALIMAGISYMELGGLELAAEGWSSAEVNSIQTMLNTLDPRQDTTTSATTPAVFISVSPNTVVAASASNWSAGIVGTSGGTVAWTFSSAGGTSLAAADSPMTLALPVEGDWTVSVGITPTNGTRQTFSTVINVAPSLFDTVTSFHDRVSGLSSELPQSVGSYQIGTTTFKLLQYEMTFPVGSGEVKPSRIIIKTLDETKAQWRFFENEAEQGLIGYRERITFETDDIRLEGVLALALTIDRIKASFYYGRQFTPAILMNDTRSVSPVDGRQIPRDTLITEDPNKPPRLPSTITARPYGDAEIEVTRDMIEVELSMLGLAAAASILILLAGLGGFAVMAILIPALAALSIATIIGVGTGVALAAAAVFLIIYFLVGPWVANDIAEKIRSNIASSSFREGFENSRLLQFSGEGIGESIARQVIQLAIDSGARLDAVAVSSESIGSDRLRQGIFQMIHVCDGQCRVLVRT